MHSLLLLALVACLLAVPGIAASLAAFPPGEVSIVTRSAAAFGLGYAASGSVAFLLAAVHAFRLSLFIPLWVAVSAVLWVLALRRASLRDHAHALVDDIDKNRLPLLLGALVIAAYLILHLKFLHLLGASRYVYYLSGIEIANSGGVPSSTMEFGQSWPPATDKAFLDAFTGVLVLLDRNVAIGPGVLLLVSTLGSALGLWATAWQLGLRRTSALLPLLVLSNQAIFNTVNVSGHGELTQRIERVSTDFTEYHAEAFGYAVAFCALALGICAIRQRRWGPAVTAGVVLAAASGTHLVPVVVVVIALCFAGAAELLRDEGNRARLMTLRQGVVLAAVSVFLGFLIRAFAGGSFGLGGAINPSGYAAIHTSFDPTSYLFTGKFLPRGAAGSGHWYVPPVRVVDDIMAGSGILWPAWGLLLLYTGFVLAAILLFLYVRTDLRTIGVIGAGILAGLIGTALFFSYHYQVYIDGTFGVRRLMDFSSLGPILLALGVLEALLLYLGRSRPRVSAGVAVAIVAALSAWLLPIGAASQKLDRVSHERIVLVDWLRTYTPCDARFLVNQRTEGALTALTGRFALLEGMGPFLRVDKLPYVINLFLDARHFFKSPLSSEAFLRQHDISYVVVAQHGQLLGYQGPTGKTNFRDMQAAPFLHRVLTKGFVTVYQVQGARTAPVTPLLKGPYLHCITAPVHF